MLACCITVLTSCHFCGVLLSQQSYSGLSYKTKQMDFVNSFTSPVNISKFCNGWKLKLCYSRLLSDSFYLFIFKYLYCASCLFRNRAKRCRKWEVIWSGETKYHQTNHRTGVVHKKLAGFFSSISEINVTAFFLRTVTLFSMWLLKPWTLWTTHSGILSSSFWIQTASKESKPWGTALCPGQVEALANSMNSQ